MRRKLKGNGLVNDIEACLGGGGDGGEEGEWHKGGELLLSEGTRNVEFNSVATGRRRGKTRLPD